MLNEQTSSQLALGQKAPNFTLMDLHGRQHSLSDYAGQIVIIHFWSAECPWVKRADELLAGWLEERGSRAVVLTVAANASESREVIWQAATGRDLTVVLHDDCQRIADLYGATNTPHFFIVDERGMLRYRGGLDDVTFRKHTPSRFYLKEAVDALLAGRQPEVAEFQPYGCTIVRYT